MRDYLQLTDNELLAMLQEDDNRAFAEIHRRYSPLLFRHAMRIFQDKDVVEDALQDVFIEVWQKRHTRSILALSSYIYKMTTYTMLAYLRKTDNEEILVQIMQQTEIFEPSAEQRLIDQELADKIEAEIERLPAKMKEVFLLKRNEDYSYREISEELNITEHTVRKQLSNAMKLLKVKFHTILFVFF